MRMRNADPKVESPWDAGSESLVHSLVLEELAKMRSLVGDHLTATEQDGVVTLEGLVRSAGERLTAVRAAQRVPGVRQVVDRLVSDET
jgi:osmotically-inducible protein OsmY